MLSRKNSIETDDSVNVFSNSLLPYANFSNKFEVHINITGSGSIGSTSGQIFPHCLTQINQGNFTVLLKRNKYKTI